MLDQLKNATNEELISAHRRLTNLAASEEESLLQKKSKFNQMIKAASNRQQTNLQVGKTMNELVAGNVGGINEVIWPFWFRSTTARVLASQSVRSDISITNEAPFILYSIAKAAYVLTDNGLVTEQIDYIDPNDPVSPNAIGLNATFTHSSSRYTFFAGPIAVDEIGHAEKPYVLDSPYMFLPNTNMEINISNTNTTVDYFIVFTFFGYRMRLENAENLLGLVTEY